MPIVVQHAPDARLHFQFAEAAGLGHYRKWVAEYKQHQKDMQTQAFLSAMGTGAQIGLAGKQMKHQAAMQTQRIKAGQVQQSIEQGNAVGGRTSFDSANSGWLSKAISQAASGASGQRGSALQTEQSLQAQDAYMRRLMDHDTNYADRNRPGSMWREYDKLQQRYIFGERAQGMGGASQTHRMEGLRERFRNSAPHVRANAEDNMWKFIDDVSRMVPEGQEIFPRHGNRAAIVGKGRGQSMVQDESTPRNELTAEQARDMIRSRRETLNRGVTRDLDRHADEMLKGTWKDDKDQKDPRKKSQHRINPDTGKSEERVIDNYHYGTAGEEHWQTVVMPRIQKRREEHDKTRADAVKAHDGFATQFDPIKNRKPGQSLEDYIKTTPESWFYGDHEVKRPKGGWQVGYFPGIPNPGRKPVPYGQRGYAPNQTHVDIQRDYDGGFHRVYSDEWLAAPTSHAGGGYNRDSHDLRYAHMRREMRQRVLAHGRESVDAMAYEDLFSTGVNKPTEEDWQSHRQQKADNNLIEKGINPRNRIWWQDIDQPFEPESRTSPAVGIQPSLTVTRGPEGEALLIDSPEGKRAVASQKAEHYKVRDFVSKWAKSGHIKDVLKTVPDYHNFYKNIVPELNRMSGLDPNANPAGWAVRVPPEVMEKMGLRVAPGSRRGDSNDWTFMSPTWKDRETGESSHGYEAFQRVFGEEDRGGSRPKGSGGVKKQLEQSPGGQAASAEDTSDTSYSINRLPKSTVSMERGPKMREQILRSFQGMPPDTPEFRNATAVTTWIQRNGDPREYLEKNPNYHKTPAGKSLLKRLKQLRQDMRNRPAATEDLRKQSNEYDERKEGLGLGPKRSDQEREQRTRTLDDLQDLSP